jgi:hypothetical protein
MLTDFHGNELIFFLLFFFSRWPTQKKLRFSKPPILKYFLRKFQGLVLGLVLLGSYYKYWSYKCFNPYFLDQPVRIFVNLGKFSNQYV